MALGNRFNQHSFAQTPAVHAARSTFNRSFARKSTYYFDQLMPFFVDEILPGDTVNINVNMFARLSTQVVPLMDNAMIDFFWFFVPNRLVWDNWEKFNGAQDDPGDSTDFTIPQLTAPAVTGFIANSVADQFGLPTEAPSISVNALPFRALCKIWNDWFRDQNINDSIPFPKDNGPDVLADYVNGTSNTSVRNKKHDYFSSCLPWPQKGTAMDIPFAAGATAIPVTRVASAPTWIPYNAGTQTLTANNLNIGTNTVTSTVASSAGDNLSFDPNGGLVINVDAYAGTINQLREAFQIQSLLELDARGGTRYVEILMAHWNVISPDFRLQRSEFLSSSTVSINSHPVPQTSSTTGTEYQAQLASFGTASSGGSKIGFSKSFVEHGYVIGLLCPRGEVSYQQGLERFWKRNTRYDFFWPKLQEIGEQAVLVQELSCTGTATDDDVFGYQERYAEYKYRPSQICGEFRSNYAQSLDSWHLAQDYAGITTLGVDFMTQSTPIDRNLASTTNANLLVDMFFNYQHARVMKTYSVPASLGRL